MRRAGGKKNWHDVDAVRAGYERVIRPRLADARFFLEQDLKAPLDALLPALDRVVFQKKIGTVGDKTRRISSLSRQIAKDLGIDSEPCERAALLAEPPKPRAAPAPILVRV